MSHDLFAAFGEAPPPLSQHENASPASATSPNQLTAHKANSFDTNQASLVEDEEDDFGDFEDASATEPPAKLDTKRTAPSSVHSMISKSSSASFPPKAQKRADPPVPDLKVGKHPFADHMDFLFSGGDDEYDAGGDDLEDLSKNPEAAVAYSKRMIAEQEAKSSGTDQKLPEPEPAPASNPPPARRKLQMRAGYAPAKDPNVLFDADNVSDYDEDDDEFGAFEQTPYEAPKQPPPSKAPPTKLQKKNVPPSVQAMVHTVSKPTMPAIDLLGLDEPQPSTEIKSRQLSQSGIMSPRSERAESILGRSKADSLSRPETAGGLFNVEDETWDDFEESAPGSVSVPTDSHSRTASSSILPTQPPGGHSKTSSQDILPPTNIPPPILLLPVFPSLFSSANDTLFNQLSRLDTLQRQQLLGHPATHQFLIGYIRQAIVLAHILAGRKLRWKRDQILAQSMRIGPATAGGKGGGMKLNSIDKSEQTKEDREATDVVAQWRLQAAKVRGAVTGATTPGGKAKLPAVPEIAEAMPVKTLKAVDGGFTAPHPCALCGLKREERLAKVDVDINDSFGEWWVNGMDMHVLCRDWWEDNKRKLKSR